MLNQQAHTAGSNHQGEAFTADVPVTQNLPHYTMPRYLQSFPLAYFSNIIRDYLLLKKKKRERIQPGERSQTRKVTYCLIPST